MPETFIPVFILFAVRVLYGLFYICLLVAWSPLLCASSTLTVLSGGYCVGVPPLPIPNREVKPVCADGTAMQCGRVGSCLLFGSPSTGSVGGGLFLVGEVGERERGEKRIGGIGNDRR